MRTNPEFDNAQVNQTLQSIVDDLNHTQGIELELEVTSDIPPVESDSESILIQVIQTHSHQPNLEPFGTAGSTDAAQFQQGNPSMHIAIYEPGIVELCHQVDEYIEASNYLVFIETYKKVITNYLN